jgi:hypothetical protein
MISLKASSLTSLLGLLAVAIPLSAAPVDSNSLSYSPNLIEQAFPEAAESKNDAEELSDGSAEKGLCIVIVNQSENKRADVKVNVFGPKSWNYYPIGHGSEKLRRDETRKGLKTLIVDLPDLPGTNRLTVSKLSHEPWLQDLKFDFGSDSWLSSNTERCTTGEWSNTVFSKSTRRVQCSFSCL